MRVIYPGKFFGGNIGFKFNVFSKLGDNPVINKLSFSD